MGSLGLVESLVPWGPLGSRVPWCPLGSLGVHGVRGSLGVPGSLGVLGVSGSLGSPGGPWGPWVPRGPSGSLGSLGSLGPLGSLGVPGTSASFGFVRGCLATLEGFLLFILGGFGIQYGFQTHVMTLPLFPKRLVEMLSGTFFLVRIGGVRGLSGTVLASCWRSLGSKWGAF